MVVHRGLMKAPNALPPSVGIEAIANITNRPDRP
jgi:hypothetical protein